MTLLNIYKNGKLTVFIYSFRHLIDCIILKFTCFFHFNGCKLSQMKNFLFKSIMNNNINSSVRINFKIWEIV